MVIADAGVSLKSTSPQSNASEAKMRFILDASKLEIRSVSYVSASRLRLGTHSLANFANVVSVWLASLG